jgi:hypothetical protein
LRQPLVVGGMHGATSTFGQGHEVTHARIAPCR